MPCTPTDIFSLATWLDDTKTTSPPSSLIRTIINRAYYAALISARELTNTPTSGPGGHTNVVNALRSIDPYIANQLNSLRLSRQKADYDFSNCLNARDARAALVISRLVLFLYDDNLPPGKPYQSDFLDSSKFLNNID